MTLDLAEPGRVAVSIPGLELITHGGLPRERLTVVSGTAGSGKTVFATHFVASGIQQGEPGIFVTFEENPASLRRDVASLGWDLAQWEQQGLLAFVDATAHREVETSFSGGGYDLSGLIARVAAAVQRLGARRVAIDSIGGLFTQLNQHAPARSALFRLASHLQGLGVTTVMTAERPDDYGPVARHGFEEYIADNVIILRNALEGEKRRRTIEVLKMRGASHAKGEHLFTIVAGQGMAVVPVSIVGAEGPASTNRLSSGVGELDVMCGGGWFEHSLTLVAGPTGTGKSLLACHFVVGGAARGERAVLHSFEESRDQLFRNATSWGLPLAELEEQGVVRVVATPPESASLEDHLRRIRQVIDDFAPDRVAIDSLTALQRISTVKSFREYVLGLSFQIKHRTRLGLVTSAGGHFLADEAATNDLHVSTISDAIVLLHYVPWGPEMSRGVHVLKLRGSDHDKSVREFRIGNRGMDILGPFADIANIVMT